jgi:hypothetical protein
MPELKLIDKTAAYNALKHEAETHVLSFSAEAYDRAARIIDQMPTIEPEVRHGRWENIDPSFAHVYCSECGAASDKHLAKRYKGCPFCLCVMDATDTNVGGKGGNG